MAIRFQSAVLASLRALLAASCMAALFPAAALAGPFEDGYSAYTRGDYATALQFFVPLAEAGNRDAEYSVGVMYANGRGLPQSFIEAAKWFHRAAEKGQAGAQYDLGVLYAKGQGVKEDSAEAAKWFRKAADQGKPSAEYNLAYLYTVGLGVPQDFVEAIKWYRKAADQGDIEAQNELGSLYGNGQGVPQDLVEAYRWFDLAASRDAAGDFETHDNAVKNRDIVAAKMTPAQIADAQKLVKAWKAM